MKVLLRNPRRELTIDGKRSVNSLLATLSTVDADPDAELTVDDVVEIRPVISGGT